MKKKTLNERMNRHKSLLEITHTRQLKIRLTESASLTDEYFENVGPKLS